MLAPVGNLPPAVYWRRRLLVGAIALALVVLTGYVLFGGGSKKDGAGASGSSVASKRSTSSSTPTTSGSTSSSAATAPPAGARCSLAQLDIAAATDKARYRVGEQENLFLVVTNPGSSACTQDLGDSRIELTIFTGGVRVWGSHDCKVVPGPMVQKLAPKRPVRVEIVWLGKTSQPGCGGTRLQATAGTYRLYAALSGRRSAPVTFTIST